VRTNRWTGNVARIIERSAPIIMAKSPVNSRIGRRDLISYWWAAWTAYWHGKKDRDSDMNESTDHQPMNEEIDR